MFSWLSLAQTYAIVKKKRSQKVQSSSQKIQSSSQKVKNGYLRTSFGGVPPGEWRQLTSRRIS